MMKRTVGGKAGESALRHRVRNLRAKVRLLLPIEPCCKDHRRTKNLLKIHHNRIMQQRTHPLAWHHNTLDENEPFIPKQPPHRQHLFHKLTMAELEQIKEDKLYYVGEEFLPHFDAFIEAQGRPAKRQIAPAPPQSLHRSSLSEVIPSYQQQRSDPSERTAQFEARRKLITEEDLSKRILLRMRRKERQQRQQSNLQRLQASQQQQLRKRSQQTQMKTCNSLRKKEEGRATGQIYQLSEQLRMLCLSRSSRSAKTVLRN